MRVFGLVMVAVALLSLAAAQRTVLAQQPPPPPPPPCSPTCATPPTIGPPPPPCPSAACPTDTPTVTPVPTSTPVPTATPVLLTLTARLGHKTIAPKQKQTVSVLTLSGSTVSITVSFPNGDSKKHSGTMGSSGSLKWSYEQPGSRITHASRTAKVTVVATNGGATKRSVKSYSIGFARIDVSAEPRKARKGQAITIWSHTNPGSLVQITLQYSGGAKQVLNGRTGSNGWLALPYRVPSNARSGRVEVDGVGSVMGRLVKGTTSFRVS